MLLSLSGTTSASFKSTSPVRVLDDGGLRQTSIPLEKLTVRDLMADLEVLSGQGVLPLSWSSPSPTLWRQTFGVAGRSVINTSLLARRGERL